MMVVRPYVSPYKTTVKGEFLFILLNDTSSKLKVHINALGGYISWQVSNWPLGRKELVHDATMSVTVMICTNRNIIMLQPCCFYQIKGRFNTSQQLQHKYMKV